MPCENYPERLLSVDETGTVLGIGRTKTYELIGSGALPTVKIGRRTLIRWSVIEALITASEVPPELSRRRIVTLGVGK